MTQNTDHELEQCDTCGRYGWHTTDRCPEAVEEEYCGYHTVWCSNTDAEFPEHSESEPYCSRLLHSIELIPEGEIVKAQMWVQPTHAFTHGQFTAAEYAERERRYGGVELSVETWGGPGQDWDEHKLRLTSDAARSLAATLIRAADIEQGLTR